MLNVTIPGGATKNAAGLWVNAEGQPLKAAQVKAIEALIAEAAEAHDAAEVQSQQRALLINPAFAGAVQALQFLRAAPATPTTPTTAQD